MVKIPDIYYMEIEVQLVRDRLQIITYCKWPLPREPVGTRSALPRGTGAAVSPRPGANMVSNKDWLIMLEMM